MKDNTRKISLIFVNISNFFRSELSGGILVLIAAIIGIIWANSPWRETYFSLLKVELGFKIGDFEFSKTLLHWINDGLMTFFFLLVGMEIKREMLVGELSSFKKSIFPVIAATGGVILPIVIYSLFNYRLDSFRGWGIPMATDIAFTIAVMMLLSKKISHASRVNITALAIADDIAALIVIAIFYSTGVKFEYVVISLVIVLVLLLLNKLGMRFTLLYVTFGFILWLLLLNSGIHATIAGVLLAFTIPADVTDNAFKNLKRLSQSINVIIKSTQEGKVLGSTKSDFQETKKLLKNIEPHLQRFETAISNWVSFLILPLFALANAGVYIGNFSIKDLTHPVVLGVSLGLLLGKSTGIFTFSYLSVKLKIADISNKVSWKEYYGVSWLAGIGFTMALFIAHLSFDSTPHYLDLAKVGIYLGSIFSVLVGTLILIFTKRTK
ncbi:MAG: Na+/H+ antiporter NhaA [Brevinematia bacterium]